MTSVPATTGEIIRALGRVPATGLDASWVRAAIDRLAELHTAAKIAYDGLGAIPATPAWNDARAALKSALQLHKD